MCVCFACMYIVQGLEEARKGQQVPGTGVKEGC